MLLHICYTKIFLLLVAKLQLGNGIVLEAPASSLVRFKCATGSVIKASLGSWDFSNKYNPKLELGNEIIYNAKYNPAKAFVTEYNSVTGMDSIAYFLKH